MSNCSGCKSASSKLNPAARDSDAKMRKFAKFWPISAQFPPVAPWLGTLPRAAVLELYATASPTPGDSGSRAVNATPAGPPGNPTGSNPAPAGPPGTGGPWSSGSGPQSFSPGGVSGVTLIPGGGRQIEIVLGNYPVADSIVEGLEALDPGLTKSEIERITQQIEASIAASKYVYGVIVILRPTAEGGGSFHVIIEAGEVVDVTAPAGTGMSGTGDKSTEDPFDEDADLPHQTLSSTGYIMYCDRTPKPPQCSEDDDATASPKPSSLTVGDICGFMPVACSDGLVAMVNAVDIELEETATARYLNEGMRFDTSIAFQRRW